jgi:hypothetical protein
MESAHKCFIKAVSYAHIETIEYTGDNAAKDVISWNLHRRHLNESHRTIVATKLANISIGDNQHTLGSANLQSKTSRSEAAKMHKVTEQ